MVRICGVEEFQELKAVIKVIGLGGGGGNAVNRMVEAGVRDVELIAANTDAATLRDSKAQVRIQLGESVTGGLGVGGKPELGRLACEESRDHLREVLAGADMVFITSGMGGGTGTGASPVVAQLAKEANALTVGVVTRPFGFEGPVRARNADEGIQKLRDNVDTLLIIPNDRLLEVGDEKTSSMEAYRKADDVLRQAVQSISDVITTTGHINVDMNDMKAVMLGAGEALMGVGEVESHGKSIEAMKMAIQSPLLENVAIEGAKGLLVNITGSSRVPISDIKDAMDYIGGMMSPEAQVKYGQVFDETMGDRLRITVVATGFPSQRVRGLRRLGGRSLMPGGSPRPPLSAGYGTPPPDRPGEGAASDWTKPAFQRMKARKLK